MTEQVTCLSAGGINWCWYIQGIANHDAKTITIRNYNRWHQYDAYQGSETHPIATGTGRIIEDAKRNAVQVEVFEKEWNKSSLYTVTNPKHVFDYRD